jgi:hypothetical protein
MEDYLGTRFAADYVCPEHRLLLEAKHEYRQTDHPPAAHNVPEFPLFIENWGIGTSYSPTVAMFTNDHALDRYVFGQGSEWYSNWLWGPRGSNPKCIGRRRLHEVSFASNKVAMWEHADRHVNKGGYLFLYDFARQPYLFFDGSCRMYTTGGMNVGSDPRRVAVESFPQFVSAGPALSADYRFEANFLPGDREIIVPSRVVTTKLGLKGVDVGGEEVHH